MTRVHLFSVLSQLLFSISGVQSLSATTARRMVVVGKIIIDEYGQDNNRSPGVVSIGGGGPQAAFGAALALASISGVEGVAKQQPVTFVAPVGDDWSEADTVKLHDLLGGAVDSIHLIKGTGLMTPRIQLWHDENQRIQWRPLHDSFGPAGADRLWNNRPSAKDFLSIIDKYEGVLSCHVISEGGVDGPGNGGDISFLLDKNVQERLCFLGVEPIAFANEETGELSRQDAASIVKRIEGLQPLLKLISPDNDVYEAIDSSFWDNFDVAIRKGPSGSTVIEGARQAATDIPAAALKTADGEPLNPTGAGNSYAGAMSVLRSRGVSLEDSACVASAVGAVFCEYEHIPPWAPHVIQRVRTETEDLKRQMAYLRES